MTSSSILSQKETFLSLVRLGIGHRATAIPEAIDWDTIQTIESGQGLSAIVLDGAQALSDCGELKGGWAYLNAVCVEDLGFCESFFLEFVVDGEKKGFFARVAFKNRRWKTNAWKQDICFSDNRLRSFIVSTWAHIIKPASI